MSYGPPLQTYNFRFLGKSPTNLAGFGQLLARTAKKFKIGFAFFATTEAYVHAHESNVSVDWQF